MNFLMKTKVALLVILGLALSGSLMAQKKELKKAEKLFNNYKYNAAIPYFEYYLDKEDKDKIVATKTKLAYCYRMANKSIKAEVLYSELVQEERFRPIILFYYGESLMANGKYNDAKVLFEKYSELKPNDENALNLIEACQKVNTIEPLFEISHIEPLDINTEADEFSPVIYEDGIAFLSDQGGRGRTYGWTGRSFLKLYKSSKSNNGKFETLEEFSKKINTPNKNTGPVSISRDGEEMIITRNSDVPSKSNRYNLQLFEVDKKNGNWNRGKVLDFCSPERNYMHPALSYSGDTMYFASDKAGSIGGTDIFMTYRTPKGWKKPVNLGELVNTAGHEAFPFVHKDGTLFFASKGHNGFGGFDLYKVERDEYGEFNKIVNLGEPINGARDDMGFILLDDNKSGFFTSSRMAGNDDIYYFEAMNIALKGDENLLAMATVPSHLNTPKSVRPKQESAIKLEGIIVDETTNISLRDVKASLVPNAGGETQILEFDSLGQITGFLKTEQEYTITLEKEGYTTKSVLLSTKEQRTKTLSATFKMSRK